MIIRLVSHLLNQWLKYLLSVLFVLYPLSSLVTIDFTHMNRSFYVSHILSRNVGSFGIWTDTFSLDHQYRDFFSIVIQSICIRIKVLVPKALMLGTYGPKCKFLKKWILIQTKKSLSKKPMLIIDIFYLNRVMSLMLWSEDERWNPVMTFPIMKRINTELLIELYIQKVEPETFGLNWRG